MNRRFFGILISLLLIAAGLYFLDSRVLLLKSIQVEGNDLISTQDIVRISGLDKQKGISIMRLRLDVASQNLMTIPYLQSVKIKRIWPDIVRIIVEERSVAAAMKWANQYVLLDWDAHVLEVRKDIGNARLPMLGGLSVSDVKIGKVLSPSSHDEMGDQKKRQNAVVLDRLRISTSIEVMKALAATKSVRMIADINVERPEEIILKTRDGIIVRFGAAMEINRKAQKMVEILPRIRKQGITSGELDLAVLEEASFVQDTPLPSDWGVQPTITPSPAAIG